MFYNCKFYLFLKNIIFLHLQQIIIMASSLPSTQNQILPATPSNYDVYNRNALKSHNYGYKNSEDPEWSNKECHILYLGSHKLQKWCVWSLSICVAILLHQTSTAILVRQDKTIVKS